VLERALEAPADQPRVERVVAVLHEHRTMSEAQESPARISKLRCADEHRTVDVVAPVGVGVDRRLAIDKRVEERQRAIEAEALGADLQDQERSVAGGLNVEGDELRFGQPRLGPHLRRIDGDLLPGHRLHRPAWLEEEALGAHLDCARARRAQAISSRVNARSSSTAPP
jgi:hypothetical protein